MLQVEEEEDAERPREVRLAGRNERVCCEEIEKEISFRASFPS